MFARNGAFDFAVSDGVAWVLCIEDSVGVHDFCVASRLHDADERLPVIVADYERRDFDCVLHNQEEDICVKCVYTASDNKITPNFRRLHFMNVIRNSRKWGGATQSSSALSEGGLS